MAVLNAGAALYVGGRADTIADGARTAGQTLDSGAAADLLERLVSRRAELVESA